MSGFSELHDTSSVFRSLWSSTRPRPESKSSYCCFLLLVIPEWELLFMGLPEWLHRRPTTTRGHAGFRWPCSHCLIFQLCSGSASKNLQEAWYTTVPKFAVNTINTMAAFIQTSLQTSSWTQSIPTITFCNSSLWSPGLGSAAGSGCISGWWSPDRRASEAYRDRNGVWKTARPLTSHF